MPQFLIIAAYQVPAKFILVIVVLLATTWAGQSIDVIHSPDILSC